jgi:hypothetical protein
VARGSDYRVDLIGEINSHAGTHPILVAVGDVLVFGAAGFVIGAGSYSHVDLRMGSIYGSTLAILGMALGLTLGVRAR